MHGNMNVKNVVVCN